MFYFFLIEQIENLQEIETIEEMSEVDIEIEKSNILIINEN
ncbi:MAG: hypothetical protein WCK02_16190 [Bacteroidota bacterium]